MTTWIVALALIGGGAFAFVMGLIFRQIPAVFVGAGLAALGISILERGGL